MILNSECLYMFRLKFILVIHSYIQEQWKRSGHKRRERLDSNEDSGHSEKRRRSGKKRKERGSKSRYEEEETGTDLMDDQEYLEDEDADLNYREGPASEMQEQDDNAAEENAQDLLAAAGLEDSDVDEVIINFS